MKTFYNSDVNTDAIYSVLQLSINRVRSSPGLRYAVIEGITMVASGWSDRELRGDDALGCGADFELDVTRQTLGFVSRTAEHALPFRRPHAGPKALCDYSADERFL